MGNVVNYVESKWVKGDVISSARLNNIEKGVLNLTYEINRLEETLGPSAADGPVTNIPPEGFGPEDSSLISAQAIAAARGAANGIAPLNEHQIIPSNYLPSYVDDILEFPTYYQFPGFITDPDTGETYLIDDRDITDTDPDDTHVSIGPEKDKIYVALDTGYTYRWSGTQYVEVSWTPDKISSLINETIDSLDVSDSADSTKYVSEVSETNGKISVSREAFSPSLTLTQGTTGDAPKINVTVAGNSMNNPIELTKASVGANGVYGVTKLSDSIDSADSSIAATPNAVKNALDTAKAFTTSSIEALDVSNISGFGADKTLSALTETDGKIAASFQTIDIASSQINDKSDAINSDGSTVATSKAVSSAVSDAHTYTDNAINALDGGTIGTPGAGKTISAISETNGQISVSFQDISITSSQISDKGSANCVATLDANGHVPSSQLPSYVDDVIEVQNQAALPATGEDGKIYIDLSTNVSYRWGGSTYVKIASDLGLGETESTAYRGDHGKAAYDHATAKGQAFSSGLYKITTNAEGHVTAASAVEKSDITELGIPAQDTTYESLAAMENGTTASLVTTGEKAQWNSMNIWDDVTSQCTFATGVTGKVMLNKAMKMGFFSCVSPSATAANTTLLTFPPLIVGNSNVGQYFNSKLDGNMLISAAIPEGSKSVKQIHSSNNASTQQFNASGMFIYREPVSHTLTIRHIGTSLPDHIETLEEYDNYTYTVPSVEHFTVSPTSLNITMGTEDQVRILTYTQITHTLTINYEYEDHTPAATTYSNVLNEGESYSVNSPVIDGFTTDTPIVSGTLNTDTTITVTYTKNEQEP